MVTSYDVAGLGELVEHMDIMHVPPEHTLFEYPAPQAQEPHLYILDTGFVSTAMDVQHMHHKQTGDQKMLRHRLAKHGTGAVLGMAGFVMHSEHLNIIAMTASTNTHCQLFRLPRTRCDELHLEVATECDQ
jgi:hypothetical protein